jgi:DNA-binding IclR family transcriptional regulator
MASSLVEAGLLSQDSSSARYRLGPRAVELGLAAMGTADIRVAAMPIMLELTHSTGETTTLSLALGDTRVYVAQVQSPEAVRMTVEIGPRMPLYAGGSGRAILSFWEASQIEEYLQRTPLVPLTGSTVTSKDELLELLAVARENGYASSMGERDPWAGSVAAPVFRANRQVIGSISVCGPLQRFSAVDVRRVGRLVSEAATQLTQNLR